VLDFIYVTSIYSNILRRILCLYSQWLNHTPSKDDMSLHSCVFLYLCFRNHTNKRCPKIICTLTLRVFLSFGFWNHTNKRQGRWSQRVEVDVFGFLFSLLLVADLALIYPLLPLMCFSTPHGIGTRPVEASPAAVWSASTTQPIAVLRFSKE
jgi:hypothetical protein